MKVRIYGSCVSRDILSFNDTDKLDLLSYNARSSIATLNKKNIQSDIGHSYFEALNKIESKFQKRMVEYDFKNKVLDIVNINNYDLLLIDLIDERFHLAQVSNKLVTRSNEFLKSGIQPDKIMNTFSPEYMELWQTGVDNFINVINETIGLDKLKINKVYWASSASNPKDTDTLNSKWQVERHNQKLSDMYEHLEKKLPKSSIIEVDPSLLVANSNHKWGLSPFHYIDEYYEEMGKALIEV